MKNTFYGKVLSGGKIEWENPLSVVAQLVFLVDKRVKITLTDELKDISDPQRKYYFGHLVTVLASEFGWDKQEMHDWLKAKFASKIEMVNIRGKVKEVRKIPSIMDLTTIEAEEFYRKIREWGNENGILLLLPNEYDTLIN